MYVLQKINKIIQIQTKRYKEKGLFNTVLSLALLFGLTKLIFVIGQACWPQHVDDKRFFVFKWTFILHTVVQFGVFALHLPGYLGLSSYYDRYMINKRTTWPWRRQNWNEMFKKSALNFIQNQLIIFPCLAYFNKPSYKFEGFPTMTEVIPQFVLIYFVEDFFTYWSHRTLHHPKLYKFHKLHHEYDKVYSLAFQYISSVQYICHSVIPSILTFSIAGKNVHCFVFFLWVIWKTIMSSEGHSGYEFPWSPMRAMPLISGSSFHDHHHSINIGNFAGSCILWDVMLQTGDLYYKEYLKDKTK